MSTDIGSIEARASRSRSLGDNTLSTNLLRSAPVARTANFLALVPLLSLACLGGPKDTKSKVDPSQGEATNIEPEAGTPAVARKVDFEFCRLVRIGGELDDEYPILGRPFAARIDGGAIRTPEVSWAIECPPMASRMEEKRSATVVILETSPSDWDFDVWLDNGNSAHSRGILADGRTEFGGFTVRLTERREIARVASASLCYGAIETATPVLCAGGECGTSAVSGATRCSIVVLAQCEIRTPNEKPCRHKVRTSACRVVLTCNGVEPPVVRAGREGAATQ